MHFLCGACPLVCSGMLEQSHFRRYRTRTILAAWRSARTSRAGSSTAIQPSTRRKTRRNRRAPKPRGRTRRRSTRRWRICSIPPSAAAAPVSARRPASTRRRRSVQRAPHPPFPPPLWGRVGRGVGRLRTTRRRPLRMHQNRSVASRPPPLAPPHKGEGNSEPRGTSKQGSKIQRVPCGQLPPPL
jgi:hypothetical protein